MKCVFLFFGTNCQSVLCGSREHAADAQSCDPFWLLNFCRTFHKYINRRLLFQRGVPQCTSPNLICAGEILFGKERRLLIRSDIFHTELNFAGFPRTHDQSRMESGKSNPNR